MARFSVIIPTFNRVQLLKDTLKSIFAQRSSDFETIVVDDGSNDGTLEYLASIEHQVSVLTQQNCGPGAARNLGASKAVGRYLAFLDSDDLWFPWTLDVYTRVLRETRHPAFMVGKPICFSSTNELSGVEEGRPTWLKFEDYLASADEWRWWGVSSFVICHNAFMSVGGFESGLRNGEDADIALRMGTAPGFVQVTAPFTFAYRQHSGNIANDLCRNVFALQHQIRAESRGMYPGGTKRRGQRQIILTRHVRPVALACAKSKMVRRAWSLYWSTFVWHVAQTRWRFLIAFPVLALFGLMRINRDTPN